MKRARDIRPNKTLRENGYRVILGLFDDFLKNRDEILWQPRKRDELHTFRKAGKPLRYAMEVFAPCFAPPFGSLLEEVKQLLEHLGSTHDSDVAILALRSYLAELRFHNRHVRQRADRISTAAPLAFLRELQTARQDHFFALCVMLEQWRLKDFRRQIIDAMDTKRPPAG